MTMKSTSFAQQPHTMSSNALPSVQGTPEQRERLSRRRRFTRLFVYLPMGVITTLWLLLFVGLIWLTIAGEWFAMDTNQAYYRRLVSGLADAFSIFMLIPMLILCAVPSVLAAAAVFYRRQRRRERPVQAPSIPIMWRVENVVVTIADSVENVTEKISRPIIEAYAAETFVRTLLVQIKQSVVRIFQELDKYVNDK